MLISSREFAKELDLNELTGHPPAQLELVSSDINRPAFPLTGYWSYFAWQRPQVIGKVEMSYMLETEPQVLKERLEMFFSYEIPCVIICHDLPCHPDMLEIARRKNVPVYATSEPTTNFVLQLINYLNNALAPHITQHAVLVDVFGSGILITGKSGVGKSEAALELVKRGHRLVADDVVDIRRVPPDKLIGEAPDMTRHFMEIRGIGIIDIAVIYGIGSVLSSKSIDLVVHLEQWETGKEYERLGLAEEYTEILGVSVPILNIPIRPGRNVAIVLEVAARNQRLKQNGFNAAKELDARLRAQLSRGTEEME